MSDIRLLCVVNWGRGLRPLSALHNRSTMKRARYVCACTIEVLHAGKSILLAGRAMVTTRATLSILNVSAFFFGAVEQQITFLKVASQSKQIYFCHFAMLND